MTFALIDTLGILIVLSTIVSAIALICTAHMLLRPGWQFAARNSVILFALIVDLLVSLRVFEPSILRTIGPLVEPGTELLYCFVVGVLVLTMPLFAWPHMRAVNDDMPISWTIWPQTFRAIGGIFLVYWAVGHMPGGFAVPAGIGDLLTQDFATAARRLFCGNMFCRACSSRSCLNVYLDASAATRSAAGRALISSSTTCLRVNGLMLRLSLGTGWLGWQIGPPVLLRTGIPAVD